jgi:hypothetical protein
LISGKLESIHPVLTSPCTRRQTFDHNPLDLLSVTLVRCLCLFHGRDCILDLGTDIIYLRFYLVVLSANQKRSVMLDSSRRTNAKMAFATTEPDFPIALRTKDARHVEPMNPSAFLFRYFKTPA